MAARVAPTRRVSAGRTICRLGASCARAGFSIPVPVPARDLAHAASAPNDNGMDDEPLYPGTCRERKDLAGKDVAGNDVDSPAGLNWRFRVPQSDAVEFADLNLGRRRYVAGKDFGDFLVWRRDDVPAYQLAVVVDDAAMRITEVVRGEDLLKSTARQLLLLHALGHPPPAYFHCELVRDPAGARLAKRHDALSIRHWRDSGLTPLKVLEMAGWP